MTSETVHVAGYSISLTTGEDGLVVAEVPEVAGCISTRESALENVVEAIEISREP